MSTLSLGRVGLGAAAAAAACGSLSGAAMTVMSSVGSYKALRGTFGGPNKWIKENPRTAAASFAIMAVGSAIFAYSTGLIAYSIGKAVWLNVAVPSLSKPLMGAASGLIVAVAAFFFSVSTSIKVEQARSSTSQSKAS